MSAASGGTGLADLGDLVGLADEVHRRVLERDELGDPVVGPTAVAEVVRAVAPLATATQAGDLVDEVVARMVGLGSLHPLLADPQVSEVMVNGDGRVWVERRGRLAATGQRLDASQVHHLIERVLAPLGRRVDRSSPLVDARLPDGSRVHAVVPPVAVDGPCVTIRRFAVRAIGLEDVAAPPVADLLRRAVRGRANVLVSGGTGAGKTTLLNALAGEIDASTRVITIEDAAELRLPGEHVVRLETRPASADGVGAVTARQLVRNALRMRPDRIIVGEVRGAEALDMLQAMNTGHEGSLSTCHANSPADALSRLEAMCMLEHAALPLASVRHQVAAAVDVVVQVERVEEGGRAVVSVGEVEPPDPSRPGRPPGLRVLADRTDVLHAPARVLRRAGVSITTGPSA